MHVLVTRPLEDAKTTAVHLGSLGHQALISPLLAITEFAGPPLNISGVQGILATSANGIRALARRCSARNVPVFAVGPQTTKEARETGFSVVRDADGDATALAEAITRWTTPERGPLLHATGIDGAGRLAGLLEGRGFEVRTETLYSVAALPLSQDALIAMKMGKIDAVALYSPRTARLFRDVVTGEDLAGKMKSMIAVCISQAAADALSPLAFSEVRIASAPNQDAMLACLG